jgi:hypothetical protein
LSYIISKVGMSMDSRKNQDMLGWDVPASVINIRSILRVVGYYKKFIEGMSKITRPMTKLLRKD